MSFWTVDGSGGSSGGWNMERTGNIWQAEAGRMMAALDYYHIGGWLAAPYSGCRIYLPLIGKQSRCDFPSQGRSTR